MTASLTLSLPLSLSQWVVATACCKSPDTKVRSTLHDTLDRHFVKLLHIIIMITHYATIYDIQCAF